jgi:predicted TIM-barrel fold metal-dependent hydrolase
LEDTVALIELPRVGAPTKALPALRKIALEEHFMMPVSNGSRGGRIEPSAMSREAGLDEAFLATVHRRMEDLHEARIEEMDQSGIDVAILSLRSPGTEGIPDAARAAQTARETNDFLAAVIAEARGRYAGFACVALQDTGAAVEELERAVRRLGFKGVLVNGYVNVDSTDDGHYLDEERFLPFWEAVSELGVPVYLHPRAPLERRIYAGHKELVGAAWGFAPETATHALRLVYSGLFDRFPKATVILGHMGETLPFFAWRIQHCFEWNPSDKRLEKRLQDYLCENFYITTSGNNCDQALICALLTIGSDRILFSTDYPFEMSTDAARWIERAPISELDRRKIAYGNAKGLFNL